MPCLLISWHKQGKFNITYVIGRNLHPWERQYCICYSNVVYTILAADPKTPGHGGKPSNLYIKYTLSQFLAIFEVRRY